jgi:hypothetical protein
MRLESLLFSDSNSTNHNFDSIDTNQFSLTQYPVTTSSFLSPPVVNQSQPLLKLNKNGTIPKKRGPKGGPRKKK